MELNVRIDDDDFNLIKLAQEELGISQQEAVSLFIECGTLLILDGSGELDLDKTEIPDKSKQRLEHIKAIAGEYRMDAFTTKLKAIWSGS